MHFILDRRSTKGNASENRQKFLRRVRNIVRESMQDSFKNKSIKDISKDGQDILIDSKKIGKSLDEPHFNYDFGGDEKWVIPGNKEYSEGDEIQKPEGGNGGGKGNKASDNPEKNEDPFIVHITQEEFLNFFFEDLELPDLLKKDLQKIEDFRIKNAGYSSSGAPSRLSVIRSMRQSLMRRMALQLPIRAELDYKIESLQHTHLDHNIIQQEIEILKNRINSVPYLDEIDLRYRNPKKETFPSSSATMICIMDNSGSMGEREKTLSRKFFFLLYLFLTRKYKKVDIIFIHHTTEAREVTEEEFFSMRESGGTVVSSALELTSNIIKEKGLSKTNLYVCQCSDGDNMSVQDNQTCVEYLNNDILPATQYYSYIQIQPLNSNRSLHNTDQTSLWHAFQNGISKKHFSQQLIFEDPDIYKVFRKLFEKKSKLK